MYLTITQQVKHLSKTDYITLRELSHIAKNLTNEAIYHSRQHFFKKGTLLSYTDLYALLKNSVNYKLLNSNMAQQILKEVNGSFQSFFALLKLVKQNKYPAEKCRLPNYLAKDGFATLVIGFVRFSGNHLLLPYSLSFKKTHASVSITLPPVLQGKKVKEIRIIPKCNARFFEIQYVYEQACIQRNLNTNNALALDLGVNNLMTCVSTDGDSFIIDGKRLKSINQWFNKENSRLQGVKDKLGFTKRSTLRQQMLADKRNRQVKDYLHKAAKKVISYCIQHDIGILVLGYNDTFQQNCHIGKRNTQNFVNIPYGRLKDMLQYLCSLNGIRFVQQEESYTSKASFWDKDVLPVFSKKFAGTYSFSGKRIKRGLYQTKTGKRFNADVNGALNILRKSNVVDLTVLYSSGVVNTPVRIRVA